MTFLPNGEVGEGKNSNEYTWRIRRGKLELLAFDGKVYSRFVQNKKNGMLEHTNDADTRSNHGQYLLPQLTPLSNGETDVDPGQDFVEMEEATTRMYEQLRKLGSPWIDAADQFAGSGLGKTQEEGVRLYLATALTTLGFPLYGKHLPSRIREPIEPDEFKHGRFSDNGATFIYHGNKTPQYVDVAVRPDDLKHAIEQMKKDWSKAM